MVTFSLSIGRFPPGEDYSWPEIKQFKSQSVASPLQSRSAATVGFGFPQSRIRRDDICRQARLLRSAP
jgi:hypothetical protein